MRLGFRKAKFYGQFNPPVDQFLFERYFRKRSLRNAGTYIECGAFDGVTESSCLFFAENLGWRALNIEASPPVFEKLKQRRSGAINIHAALSDDSGVIEFTHVYHPVLGQNFGNGSVAHTKEHRDELDRTNCSYKTFCVPKRTYRSIIDEYELRAVDLMVLDIEGHELAAINGMEGCDVLPGIFCVEFGHVGLENLKQVLGKLGYTFDTTSFANAYF